MSQDETRTDGGGTGIQITVDPPGQGELPSGQGRRSSIRPFLPTLPSGVVVNDFQDSADQQEVWIIVLIDLLQSSKSFHFFNFIRH